MSFPTKLDAIVTHNPVLRKLFRNAAKHQNTALRVKSLVAEPLRSHIQLVAVREDTIVLTADSSAWAAKMRYQVPNLVKKIRKTSEFAEIQTIRVTVLKSSSADTLPRNRKAAPISVSCASALKNRASSVDDPALKEVLLRLASRRGV
ncbi:MAG TPA: hypothetical protein DGR97_07065 [Gammaproteobacteria bacterium]|nr:hypothetical protein [Gammaproteobacteria bacterium]|tara:strand:- start:2263 stop:2706 length:444 start_codon:yes stop_codon:yes gene_type:complete